jgi:hypothetical protein
METAAQIEARTREFNRVYTIREALAAFWEVQCLPVRSLTELAQRQANLRRALEVPQP